MCVVGKVSLTLRMRNMWSFIFYLGRTQLLLPPAILEYLSTGDVNSNCSAWGPSISCLTKTRNRGWVYYPVWTEASQTLPGEDRVKMIIPISQKRKLMAKEVKGSY